MGFEFAGAELPSGWVLTPIESVIPHDGLFSDGDWVESKDQDPNGDVRLIQLADVGEGVFHNRSARFLTSEKAAELRCTYLRKGDILIARMPDPLGRACVFPFDGDRRFVTVVDVCIVRTDQEQVDRTYLCYALNFLGVRKQIEDRQTGTTRKRISRRNLAMVRIPLPPIDEQRRIAAKIDELHSELDTGIKILKETRSQLETYRQAVLRYAFEGKLTTQWRDKNEHILETPGQLLERIKRERKACYEQRLREWKSAAMMCKGADRTVRRSAKPKRPRSFSDFAEEQPLTDVWPTFELGDLVSVSSGRSLTSNAMKTGKYPVYGGNGINGYHDEYLVSEPTLIIGRVGAKCGVTHITSENSWITDNALIVSPLIGSFDKRYFKSLLEYKNLNTLGSSTGQPVISAAKIYPVKIPLPTLSEQIRIADTIEKENSSIDDLTSIIDNQLLETNTLWQSVLRRAFSGLLVPQGLHDEAASVLLGRIRDNREQTKRRVMSRTTARRKKG